MYKDTDTDFKMYWNGNVSVQLRRPNDNYVQTFRLRQIRRKLRLGLGSAQTEDGSVFPDRPSSPSARYTCIMYPSSYIPLTSGKSMGEEL
jgi:hypothetical protein